MGFSTVEMWNRQKAAREELRKKGVEDVFKAGVRNKIKLVIDSAVGRRTFRNLWGLNLVRQQELFHWNYGLGLFPDSTFVGGRRFGIYSDLGELGEELVSNVMDEFGGYGLVSEEEKGHKESKIETRTVYKSGAGVEFHRLAYRINRIQKVGDREEWVPGFPPTYDISWHVVFPK